MNLQEFLNANTIEGLEAEVPVSDRMRDKDGKLYLFKIKSVSQEEYSEIQREALKINSKTKNVQTNLSKMNEDICVAGCVYPNFKDAEFIKEAGCTTPNQYLNKVLRPGEIVTLADHIRDLSGFDEDVEELEEEVKNY